MFGGDTAAEALNHIEDTLAHLAAARLKLIDGHGIGFQNIEVYIAVANVAVPDDFEIRVVGVHHGLDLRQQFGDLRDRRRNIIFVMKAEEFEL